jgi:hypothetical protein
VEVILRGGFKYFSNRTVDAGFPPDWFTNPFGGARGRMGCHWSRIGDFAGGDIKGVWELGRFAFSFPLIRAFRKTGERRFLDGFWRLAGDWFEKNPPNWGPHWMCGQEAAIRVMAWVFAWFAAPEGQSEERKNLLTRLVEATGERIEGNIGYALSQKNNHGISEAAGLWMAGLLLGEDRWSRRGKALLEEQVAELIYEDGGFSQHSANYHRLMLDVCLWCLQLGRANGDHFSEGFVERIRRAGRFLEGLIDAETGRVPNWGSNDGALVLPLTDCDYLDFRPVVQAVSVLIDERPVFPAGPWDEEWRWLGGSLSCENPRLPESRNWFPESGLAILRQDAGNLVLFCPQAFRHRPAQCDALHVDLWMNGINVLRDGGTFSYNCEEPWQNYFKSVAAHNTVQFDGRDQMPKIGRFLYGNWLECDVKRGVDAKWISAEYVDGRGCRHKRMVEVLDNGWRVTDFLSGFSEKAVLRWRLAPEWSWRATESGCESERCNLFVVGEGIVAVRLAEGWESLYYQDKQAIPVLEVEVAQGLRTLVTNIVVR